MNTNERWRDAVGYGGYQVSDMGRIRSGLVRKGCWKIINGHVTKYGYRIVSMYAGTKTRFVHRLVLEAFVGPPPLPYPEIQAAHLNGNKLDNRLENLKWCTPKENTSHKKIHGTERYCEERAFAKLTYEKAKTIRARHAAGESCPKIARDYGVGDETIRRVVIGKRYIHPPSGARV